MPMSDTLMAYCHLVRLHRPVGIHLLLWPTLCALWIASDGFPPPELLLIFVLGTVIMRSAGCCINDFADYQIDGEVLRTRERPLATGRLRRRDALAAFAVLSLAGFVLTLFTNLQTILLAVAAVPIIALYPFLKRVTHLPQLVLGVAFSWGILMAFTAGAGSVPGAAWLLFAANLLWTVVYDTQYAMADREYDQRIGVKSTAILFGGADNLIIGALQALTIVLLWLAGRQFELGAPWFFSLIGVGVLFGWQQMITRSRRPEACFRAFVSNQWVGLALLLGVVLGLL